MIHTCITCDGTGCIRCHETGITGCNDGKEFSEEEYKAHEERIQLLMTHSEAGLYLGKISF